MLNIKKEKDQKMFEGVTESYENFFPDKKLRKIIHQCNTQCNESLNMRLVKLAPKSKKFSCKKSLDCSICMVAGRHNLGIKYFYYRPFTELNLKLNPVLDNCLESNKKWKKWKQEYDKKQEQKRV